MFSASISAEEKVKRRKVRKKRCIFWKERENGTQSLGGAQTNRESVRGHVFGFHFCGVISWEKEEWIRNWREKRYRNDFQSQTLSVIESSRDLFVYTDREEVFKVFPRGKSGGCKSGNGTGQKFRIDPWLMALSKHKKSRTRIIILGL